MLAALPIHGLLLAAFAAATAGKGSPGWWATGLPQALAGHRCRGAALHSHIPMAKRTTNMLPGCPCQHEENGNNQESVGAGGAEGPSRRDAAPTHPHRQASRATHPLDEPLGETQGGEGVGLSCAQKKD